MTDTAPLERDRLVTELLGALPRAERASGNLVFLGGEAGIGKTTTIRLLGERVARTARVLVGGCEPLAAGRPLGPLLDVADALDPRVRALVDGAGAARERVFDATLAALGRPRTPTVVVFEDAHWADDATLDLVRFLGRRIERARALLIVTYRDDELGPRHPLRVVLGDLAATPGVRRVRVPPLSLGAVERMTAGSGLDPRDVHRRTDGNPFFVSAMVERGADGVPETVLDAVAARVARASPSARDAVAAASVLGLRAEPAVLRAMGVDAAALEACTAAGLLTVEGDALAFRHELVRSAIYEGVSPVRRLELHRSALAALEAAPGATDLATLAHHAAAAGDADAVLRIAPDAARRAARLGAHREAFVQIDRARPFVHRLPDGERLELLELHATEAAHVDRLDLAIASWTEAAAGWRRVDDQRRLGRALTELAGARVGQGDNAGADAAMTEAIGVLQGLGPSAELASAYRYQAHLRMLDRDTDAAVAWSRRALEAAEAVGANAVTVAAGMTLGAALLVGGRPGALETLEGVIEQARARSDWHVLSNAYGNLGSGAGEMFLLDVAEPALRAAIQVASEHELDNQAQYALAWLALVRLERGAWDEAGELASGIARRHTASTIARIMALVALGRLRSRRGDPGASEALDEALELALPTGTLQRIAAVRAARAEAAALAGDDARARDEAAAAYPLAVERRHAWFVGELGTWLRRCGGDVSLPPFAALPFALEGAGRLAEAAAAWDDLGCPYRAADALARSDDRDELRLAHDRLLAMDARPATATVARRLRALGVRGVPRRPRSATREHPAGLTPGESEVLDLLVLGHSNAAIAQRRGVSPKTVAHQVSSILSKLEVRSRTEAAAAARRLGLVDEAPGATPDGRAAREQTAP